VNIQQCRAEFLKDMCGKMSDQLRTMSTKQMITRCYGLETNK